MFGQWVYCISEVLHALKRGIINKNKQVLKQTKAFLKLKNKCVFPPHLPPLEFYQVHHLDHKNGRLTVTWNDDTKSYRDNCTEYNWIPLDSTELPWYTSETLLNSDLIQVHRFHCANYTSYSSPAEGAVGMMWWRWTTKEWMQAWVKANSEEKQARGTSLQTIGVYRNTKITLNVPPSVWQ